MSRANVIKSLIRLGMKVIPNKLSTYRLISKASHFLIRPPQHFQIDAMKIGHIPVLWVNHKQHCSSRVILYLHGGGYAIGSNSTHIDLAARIARAARSQMLMVEYRLAPEHPYPAALEDAIDAYRYLLNERVPAEKIVIAGDSAGGGLTMALLQTIRDQCLPSPAGAVCLSPWLDLSCSMSSHADTLSKDPLITPERIKYFASHYASLHDRAQPGLSPFHGELADLPPIFIQVGGDEMLLPECERFSKKVSKRGGQVELEVWPGMFHVWQIAARFLPEAREAIRHIGAFVQRVTPV